MSCGSKSEDRKQRERRRRFNGSLESRTVRGRDREREREKQKTLFQKIMHSLNVLSTMCVFNAHFLYRSFGGLTEVLSYFNALKERLHKPQNIYSLRNIFLRVTRFSEQNRPVRSVPTDSVLGLTDRSLPTRSSASSADSADVELVSQHSPSSST